MKTTVLKLKKTELEQLLSYCEDRNREGWYYGNKEQFEKRHFEIETQIERALEALTQPNNHK